MRAGLVLMSVVIWLLISLSYLQFPYGTDFCSVREDAVGLTMDNPHLISLIHKHYLRKPPTGSIQLQNPAKTDFSQYGQSMVVASLLANKTGGVFVECGASDGETLSNTLYMERHLAWTGLLVEPDPQRYTALVAKQRHAYTSHTCLSPTRRAASMEFMYNGPYSGGLANYLGAAQGLTEGRSTQEVTLTCLPLYSLLIAMGITHVDYLSLDVEGPEVEILETIPWDRITINVLTVEYKYKDLGVTNGRRSMDKIRRVRRVVMGTGLYVDAGTVATLDVVFKRKHLIL